ncbi:MAG: MBL fold metallo-hydrolase [Candidatus Thorarchaeota archaeon]|nr:MBL fold metallo-hydrolase [Candidatus Thorarchaeota archaeon]
MRGMTAFGSTKTGLVVVLVVAGLLGSVALFSFMNMNPSATTTTTTTTTDTVVESEYVNVTLLYNAGVMIEALGIRIYIDPISLNDSFMESHPADIICITHPHGDHYDAYTIHMLQIETTVNIFPENMTTEISTHDGIGLNPCDSVQVGSVNITAYYMYTTAPEGYEPSHPKEANWTSYIIDLDGFVIFHAGDSKCIDEYHALTGLIDLAFLPLGPGCQTMTNDEVVDAIQIIQPAFFIPIHYGEGVLETFVSVYGTEIEVTTDCELVALEYYTGWILEVDT